MLREVVVPVTIWCLAAIPHVVYAQEPEWETMSYTSHADFQAVDSMGFGTFPLTEPIRMQGVVLNRSADMLDPAPAAPGFLGGLWQVYVQSPEPTDCGGTALWMGQYIGKIVGNHPDGSYTDLEWLAELDRLSHDPDTGYAFQVGDKVEIRARAPGLHFRGKNNVNEQHTNDPGADFDVVLLEPDFGLPSPELITLSDLKDASDNFIFDADRLIGCEHYQGTLVRVNDISFVDTTDWGPDAVLVIQDGTGRTFPVKLGCGDGYSDYFPPAGPFDVIGILDQEDLDSEDGHLSGYRIWLTEDYDDNGSVLPQPFPKPGDLNTDGDVDLVDYSGFADCMAGPDTAPQPTPPTSVQECLDAFDFDGDQDVDLRDFQEFQRVFTGVTTI